MSSAELLAGSDFIPLFLDVDVSENRGEIFELKHITETFMRFVFEIMRYGDMAGVTSATVLKD